MPSGIADDKRSASDKAELRLRLEIPHSKAERTDKINAISRNIVIGHLYS
jgi:hypothetical protein